MNMEHVLDALRSGKPVSRSLAHEAARLIELISADVDRIGISASLAEQYLIKDKDALLSTGNELVDAVDELLLAYTTTSYEKRIVALNRVFNAQDAWRKETTNEQDQVG